VFSIPLKIIPESKKATKFPPGIERPQSAVTKVRSLSGNH
jgi:hypothetical protein